MRTRCGLGKGMARSVTLENDGCRKADELRSSARLADAMVKVPPRAHSGVEATCRATRPAEHWRSAHSPIARLATPPAPGRAGP